jgi:DNA primase
MPPHLLKGGSMGEQVKVDFKTLKTSVAITSVLEHYNVTVRRSGKTQLVADCPLPTHASKESKGSFKVNTDRNVWCCKSASCVENYAPALLGKHGGDVIDFVSLMEKTDTLGAAKKLLEWFPQNVEPKQNAHTEQSGVRDYNPNPTPVPEENKAVPASNTSNKPLSFELKGITYHPYLESRGISKELAAKFGIGFFPGKGSMEGRIVIPIRDENGALVAYAGRSVNGTEPRYKLPAGFQKSLVLYNRFAVTGDAVVIVEGFFDCIRVSAAGFPCVALMGSTLSEAQEKLLTFKRIVLLLDGDEAGKAGTAEILPRLAKHHYVRTVEIAGQPDSLTVDEIKTLIRFC